MPKPINRNDRRRLNTRKALLAAAKKIFAEQGVDGTTVSDITNAADVAHGSFYNHFVKMDDLVAELAEDSIRSVAESTLEFLKTTDDVEILPCIGARVVMRLLATDPAIRWLVDRPHIFAEEFHKVGKPFMRTFEAKAVQAGSLRPAGSHETWLHYYPWLLLAELSEAIESGDTSAHEERFAQVSLRFLGVDDAHVPELLRNSERLMARFRELPSVRID